MDEDYVGVNVQLAHFFVNARRIHDNVWLIQSPHPADDVLRVLTPHIFVEGGLLIAEVQGTSDFTGFKRAKARFIKELL
jgi:hypothetical protein